MILWATNEQAREFWADAPADDGVLDILLDAARGQCEAFAPAPADPPWPLPEDNARYVLAHIYQAREIYAASQRGEQDVIGIGDFAIRARPLTAAVKSLLRPSKGPRAGVG